MSGDLNKKVQPRKSQAIEAVKSDPAYAEFLPAAVGISVRPAPIAIPMLIGLLIAAVAVTIAWSAFSYLDVYTNAAGRVHSSIRPSVVQPVENGRISVIDVKNGLEVRKGDVLVLMDNTQVKASFDSALSARYSRLAEVERRKVAMKAGSDPKQAGPDLIFTQGIPPNVAIRETTAYQADIDTFRASVSAIDAQIREAKARLNRFEKVIAAQKGLMKILNEKARMKETLLSSGMTSRAELLTAEEARAQLQVELSENSAQLQETDANITSLEEQQRATVSSFMSEQSQAIQAAEREIEQLDQEIVRQRARLAYMSLRSPIDGTVQQLAVTGAGQVVSAGQTLMVVVPKTAEPIVEALIPSSEIGFVNLNDEVTVKADAFPFTRYGAFSGRVVSISRDAVTIQNAQALQDTSSTASGTANAPPTGIPTVSNLFFIAKIALDSAELLVGQTNLRLEPGMTVRAEIKTESRRVIDYVLSPVTEVLKSSGHER